MSAETDLPSFFALEVAETVSGVFDYVFACLTSGTPALEPVPLMVLEQARRAAKSDLRLANLIWRHTVCERTLRRAIDLQLADGDVDTADHILTIVHQAVDNLTEAAAAEFEAETARRSHSSNRVLARTLSLLKEEIRALEIDGYLMDRWHVGLVTDAPVSRERLLQIAHDLGGQALVVDNEHGQMWAWIGKSQEMNAHRVGAAVTDHLDGLIGVGVGEPRMGLSGWRLTHVEARTAAELPNGGGDRVTFMRKHVLEAAILGNRVFTECLNATYMHPLEAQPSKMAAELRNTLRAYLMSGQNAKSAAQRLGIDRHTVLRRVRKVEELVGERVEECCAQLDTALRLEARSGTESGVN